MKQDFYSKPWQFFFHGFFLFTALLALYFFKERLFVDTTYFAFYLLNDETFRVEHQRFIEIFVLAGGNLKQIAEQAGVSYPTVRSRLDKVIESLRQEIAATQEIRGTILDAVGEDKRAIDEAARIIKSV